MIALGKLPQQLAPLIEPTLLEHFQRAKLPADRQALGEALGKLGGRPALDALRAALGSSAPLPPVLAQVLERLPIPKRYIRINNQLHRKRHDTTPPLKRPRRSFRRRSAHTTVS